MLSPRPVVVTHDGTFHADDAMAIAVCQLFFGISGFSLIRTRNEDTINKADYVFDVGNVFDESAKRFDHHMLDCPCRNHNADLPYSSAGLSWKYFGKRVVGYIYKGNSSSDINSIFNKVDNQVFVPIDLIDNGIGLDKTSFNISHIIGNMNPTWNSDMLQSTAFEKAVSLCRQILVKNIKSVISDIEAVNYIKYYLNHNKSDNRESLILDGMVLVLPIKVPYVRAIYSLGLTDVKFVITPENGNYLINTIPDNGKQKSTRLDFPKEWAGLRNEELEKVTGIPGSLFCHTKLFIAGATNFKAAKEMVRVALSMNNQGWKINNFIPIG